MSLARKLNLKEGVKARVIGRPRGIDLDDVATTTSTKAAAVLAFSRTLSDLDATCGPAIEAARADRIAWIAYPKAGKLDTDLNRDVLSRYLSGRGVQSVRLIALDNVWSAMRFRPEK
jgi:hypothetical protein